MKNKNEIINNLIKESTPKRNVTRNMIRAFFVGGFICLVAQFIKGLLILKFDEKTAQCLSTISMIILGSFLTGIGWYDKIGQFAGAGTIIPITGFANSMTSSAIESHSEGLVLGVLNNIFKLAGSVISVSIICGVISGLIRYLGGVIFG